MVFLKDVKSFFYKHWAEIGFLMLLSIVCVDTTLSTLYLVVSDRIKHNVETTKPEQWGEYNNIYNKDLFVVTKMDDEHHPSQVLITNSVLGKQFWVDKSLFDPNVPVKIADQIIVVYLSDQIVQIIKVN